MKIVSRLIIVFLLTSMLLGCTMFDPKSSLSDDVNSSVPDTTVYDAPPEITTTVDSTTTNEPITQPLPEVTYEILLIDGEYYLEFSGADAYGRPTDSLSRTMIKGLGFNSVDEMYDKIINHKLSKEQMIKMYYEEWGHLNNNRIKVFNLSTMIIPTINGEVWLFPPKNIVGESVRWYGDHYIISTSNGNFGWYFSTRDEESFGDILQNKRDEFSKLELETVKRSDGIERKIATKVSDDGGVHYEQFSVEDNGKNFYVFSNVYYYESRNESSVFVYVYVEDNGLYYIYQSDFVANGHINEIALGIEDIRRLSYEKVPYVAK